MAVARTSGETFSERVSLIIPFKNEANHLPVLLASLKVLAYPSELLEVILIDDHSTDSYLEKLESVDIPFKVKWLKASNTGKKQAVQEALDHASGDLVLFTDADCIISPEWICEMVLGLRDKKCKMTIGPVVYSEKTGLSNALYQLDFLALIGFTEASLYAGRPTMANAANMGFNSEFRKNIQISDLRGEIPSGDDVFILHHLKSTQGSEAIQFVSTSIETAAPNSFLEFIRQRVRWGSKASAYKDLDTQILSWLIFLTNLIIVASLLFNWKLTLLLIALKAIPDFLLLRTVAYRWKRSKSLRYFLLSSLIYPFYLVLTAILCQTTKVRWKD